MTTTHRPTRIRLSVPLNLFFNASDLSALNPTLCFQHGKSEIHLTLKGGAPLKIDNDNDDEPHFRTISHCQIEITEKSPEKSLQGFLESQNYLALTGELITIVNRTMAAIRNFGWVTTAKKYKPEKNPEALLRAWEAKARLRGKWREVAPKPPKQPFDYLGLARLDENIERSSLSAKRWLDIEEALVERLKPNPEQEFLTNALQHLREDNLRLALIEATVCLEIVLSSCLTLYLDVARRFPKKKTNDVLNNVGLTSRVGLLVDRMLSYNEVNVTQINKVLRAINLRNTIIHRTGHLDPSVPPEEVGEAIYAMLNLALTLGRKRDKLRAQPQLEKISSAIASEFQCPQPEIDTQKHHKVSVVFSYPSDAPAYLRRIGEATGPEIKLPGSDILEKIVRDLGLKLQERDRYFVPDKHLSIVFRKGVLGGVLFASFEDGKLKISAGQQGIDPKT